MSEKTSSASSGRYRIVSEFFGLLIVLILLVGFFSVKADNYFQPSTFTTIANQIPDSIVVAIGMTFVLIIGGIDLSVGSVLALSGAVLALALKEWGWPLPLAFAAALGSGLLAGALNGAVTVRWALPSFIVTLGMLEIARGGALLLTNEETVYTGSAVAAIDTNVFRLSLPFYASILLVVVAQLVLSYSTVGRYMIAIGTREEAAHLSGIRITPIKVGIFMLSGMLAALAGIIQTARLQALVPSGGVGFELQAIAAVVVGGTSLMGGRGSVVGSFLGVLIIAVLESGLDQIGAADPTKRVVTGLVIVLAVIVDYYRSRLARQS